MTVSGLPIGVASTVTSDASCDHQNACLQEQHWALQHEAMLALLAFARSPCTDLNAVLPRQLCDEGARLLIVRGVKHPLDISMIDRVIPGAGKHTI